MVYRDAATQTLWAGLMQRTSVRPELLLSPPKDTTTPPDEMLTEKEQFHDIPSFPATQSTRPKENNGLGYNLSPKSTLLERRKNHPGLIAPIAMPETGFSDEVPLSPPPTHAVLSPLPEANIRHAGHTPLRQPSPPVEGESAGTVTAKQIAEPVDADRIATPDEDVGLNGALTLPTNPVDGAEDHIGLDALDSVLSKIAKQQAILRGEFDEDDDKKAKEEEPEPVEEDLALSRKGSADSRKSEVVDGVLLKTPPSNFGAPFGQL